MSVLLKVLTLFVSTCLSAQDQAERCRNVKIKYKVEDKTMEFDLTVDDVKGWVNISIDDEDDENVIQEKVQEIVDDDYNKPEYNIWHRETRHIGFVKSVDNDGDEDIDSDESMYYAAKDKTPFIKDDFDRKEQEMREQFISMLRQFLDDDSIKMFIMLKLDGYSNIEYAEMTNDTPNNVSHKLRRIIKKIREKYDIASFLNELRGY